MTDLSLEIGFENNKAPLQWFGRRPQWRICFVCFFSAEKLSLSLCFFVTEQTLSTGSKLCQAESQMGFYRTCQAVTLSAMSQNSLLNITVL